VLRTRPANYGLCHLKWARKAQLLPALEVPMSAIVIGALPPCGTGGAPAAWPSTKPSSASGKDSDGFTSWVEPSDRWGSPVPPQPLPGAVPAVATVQVVPEPAAIRSPKPG
jgi:hypothetical protein